MPTSKPEPAPPLKRPDDGTTTTGQYAACMLLRTRLPGPALIRPAGVVSAARRFAGPLPVLPGPHAGARAPTAVGRACALVAGLGCDGGTVFPVAPAWLPSGLPRAPVTLRNDRWLRPSREITLRYGTALGREPSAAWVYIMPGSAGPRNGVYGRERQACPIAGVPPWFPAFWPREGGAVTLILSEWLINRPLSNSLKMSWPTCCGRSCWIPEADAPMIVDRYASGHGWMYQAGGGAALSK
jgi:hypothetical protein